MKKLILFSLLLMLLLPINSFSQTRGERNNNPGNLKSVKILTYEIGKDKDGFSVFATKEDGLKAIIKNLRHYKKKGWDTPRKIITRWTWNDSVPPNVYIEFVCLKLKKHPDDKLNFNKRTLYILTKAIVRYETGRDLPENYYKYIFS